MKKNILIISIAIFCAVIASSLVAFVPPIQSKAQTALRLIQAEIRKLNPPDPYVSAPDGKIDTKALLEASPTDTQEASPSPDLMDNPELEATPSPTLAPPPSSASIPNVHQEFQTWNNCGPATVTMQLRTLGYNITQAEIAPQLKPSADDKNVNPWEIESFLNGYEDLSGLYRINGDMTMLKRFLAAGYPVIVEVWFEREPNDGMGHYRILRGYDDGAQHFVGNDSYEGSNQVFSYESFDQNWKVYNRTYIVAYTADQEQEVQEIISEQIDDEAMIQQAIEKAQQEVKADENDAYAWFNLGTALSMKGDYEQAAAAFDASRKIGLPWRMLWYQFELFEAYLAVGRYDDVIELTSANLNQSGDLEESHYYKGRAFKAQGRTDEARNAYEQALRFNPQLAAAQEAIDALE